MSAGEYYGEPEPHMENDEIDPREPFPSEEDLAEMQILKSYLENEDDNFNNESEQSN